MIRLAGVALVVMFASACYCRPRIIQSPATGTNQSATPHAHDIIAPLPGPETGTVGRAVVARRFG